MLLLLLAKLLASYFIKLCVCVGGRERGMRGMGRERGMRGMVSVGERERYGECGGEQCGEGEVVWKRGVR